MLQIGVPLLHPGGRTALSVSLPQRQTRRFSRLFLCDGRGSHGDFKGGSRKEPPFRADHRSVKALTRLPDLHGDIDQVFFLRSILLPQARTSHSAPADTLSVRLQRTLRPAACQPSFCSARFHPRLQKEALFNRFKDRLFLPACRDQKFLHVPEVSFLHGKAAVKCPVLRLRENLLKSAAVKKGCCSVKILLRHMQKIFFRPDRAAALRELFRSLPFLRLSGHGRSIACPRPGTCLCRNAFFRGVTRRPR